MRRPCTAVRDASLLGRQLAGLESPFRGPDTDRIVEGKRAHIACEFRWSLQRFGELILASSG
jgi:hypothetical protein